MKAFIGVTDNDWFNFLSHQTGIEEVNFWTPSGKPLANFAPGTPFLFKLHAPDSRVAGGGFFTHFRKIPVALAWDAFGILNGAPSLAKMRSLIEKRRKATSESRSDYSIGCTMLSDPFFIPDRY